MGDNIEYGFDPHDNSDKLNIHDNTVYGNGNHGIIASKRCNDVSIQDGEVYDGGNAGIFLYHSSDDVVVADVQANAFKDNKYVIRLSVGCADNAFEDNDIVVSSKCNVYIYEGSDKPYVVGLSRCQDNDFSGNNIEGREETIKLQHSDATSFVGNAFSDVPTIRLDDATDVLMSGNTDLDGNYELKIQKGGCFDPASDSGFMPTF